MSYNDTCCRMKQEEIDAADARIAELEAAIAPLATWADKMDEIYAGPKCDPGEMVAVLEYGQARLLRDLLHKSLNK